VQLVDSATGVVVARATAFEPAFRGGVRVALGDVDGDGIAEVVAGSGPGRVGEIRVFRQQTSGSTIVLTEMPAYRTLPFGTAYTGGVEISVGDLDGNGREDLVAAMSRGRGTVSAFRSVNAADPIENAPYRTFTPFNARFDGGATVTVADVGTFSQGRLTNAAVADGRMEIVVGSGAGMRSTVLVYDVSATPRVVTTILPFPARQVGGVSVSAGRLNADTIDDIIVASGRGGGSLTRNLQRSGRSDRARGARVGGGVRSPGPPECAGVHGPDRPRWRRPDRSALRHAGRCRWQPGRAACLDERRPGRGLRQPPGAVSHRGISAPATRVSRCPREPSAAGPRPHQRASSPRVAPCSHTVFSPTTVVPASVSVEKSNWSGARATPVSQSIV